MEIREGYKQTEVGVIPINWDIQNILENSTLKARIGWQGLTTAEYLEQGEFYLVTGTDFFNGEIQWSTCHFVDKKRYLQDSHIQLKNGDILVTKDGTIGKVAYIINIPGPATLNSGVFVIRPQKDSYNPLFFFYVLTSNYFITFLNQLKAGSTISHLYQKDFVNFNFIVPPLPEQHAIAAALSDADALISRLENLIAKKRNIKQGAMQELLTGKKRLLGFSGKWEVKKLGEIADYKNGKSFENYINENGNYFLITLNSIDIKGQLKSEHLRIDINDNSLNKDDLVMILSDVAHGNFLGLTDVIPEDNKYVLNQRVGALKNLRGVLPFYLSKFININQKYFKMIGQGSSQQNLGKDDILNFEILIPPIPEQTAIAQILSDMDAEIEQLEQKLAKYRMLKQGMMRELLTGKTRLM